MWTHTAGTRSLPPPSSRQQFSSSRESHSADTNIKSMCFCQDDLWLPRLSHTHTRSPLLSLLCKYPRNLLKATISSLLFITIVSTVIYVCLRAAVWVTLGERNGHFTPTALQLLFSSAPRTTDWTPELLKPLTAMWTISCEILPHLNRLSYLMLCVSFICCYDETCRTHSGKAFSVSMCYAMSTVSCSVSQYDRIF